MNDLTAARERHTGRGGACEWCLEPVPYDFPEPAPWPCDAALFRDEMDSSQMAWMLAVTERDAARALAKELAEALNEMCDALDKPGSTFRYSVARAALAKWEASR